MTWAVKLKPDDHMLLSGAPMDQIGAYVPIQEFPASALLSQTPCTPHQPQNLGDHKRAIAA